MKAKSTSPTHKEPISQKSTEETLIFTILEVAAQLNKRTAMMTSQAEITTQQWLIMLFIDRDPNISYIHQSSVSEEGILASEIAEALNVSRPNITNLINSLTRKGLIIQVEDTEDKRRKRLRITTKGEKILQQIEPYRKQFNNSLFHEFDPEVLEKMNEDLQNILQHLNANKKRAIL